MKTCLYSLSHLDGYDKSGSSRLERTRRFIEYYWPLRDQFGFTDIVLSDNGSTSENIGRLLASQNPFSISNTNFDELMSRPHSLKVYKFLARLDFGSTFGPHDPRGHLDYPYCWRGLDFIGRLFDHYEKIIFIDTDSFVLSPELAKKIKEFNGGWATLWCSKYNFPEASFQVITREGWKRYPPGPWHYNVGRIMEWALPFTEIWMEFFASRFGEDFLPATPIMDFYGQAPTKIELEYRG